MNPRGGFYRKIAYWSAIVVLLLPLSFLSQPATIGLPGEAPSRGGKLSQLRDEYHLGQDNLGEINLTSESLKLATLGMRGPAANILWAKANHYKMVEDWTNLSATLEQITKLQPNFIAVWRFQSWNLSYNVAVEFDDYHDRYAYIIKGIRFLKEGMKYNSKDPRLIWDLGWFIAQKMGRADEHKQYRRLFVEDDEFHKEDDPGRSKDQRDNWLVGREKFLDGQRLVDKGIPVKGTADVVFHSSPSMCLINYADAMEDEGTFGERAKLAWIKAGEDWRLYGRREIPSTDNLVIQLDTFDALEQELGKNQRKIDELAPAGLRDEILKEKEEALTKTEKAALQIEPEARSREQSELASNAEDKLRIDYLEIANRIRGENRSAALEAAESGKRAQIRLRNVGSSREIVNFAYWQLRCQFESTDDAISARELIFKAEQAARQANFEKAKDLFEQAFQKWRLVLDKFPDLLKITIFTDDLADGIDKYRRVLREVSEQFPEKFILQDVLEASPRAQAKPTASQPDFELKQSSQPKPPQPQTKSPDKSQ